MISVIRRLEGEFARLLKNKIDTWGDDAGGIVYTKDTREIHNGHT